MTRYCRKRWVRNCTMSENQRSNKKKLDARSRVRGPWPLKLKNSHSADERGARDQDQYSDSSGSLVVPPGLARSVANDDAVIRA